MTVVSCSSPLVAMQWYCRQARQARLLSDNTVAHGSNPQASRDPLSEFRWSYAGLASRRVTRRPGQHHHRSTADDVIPKEADRATRNGQDQRKRSDTARNQHRRAVPIGQKEPDEDHAERRIAFCCAG